VTRTRADSLVLINWKGVFYYRYLLDRHVTALEGANGAGKTTVMIAAYVVLLPDMSRLRFTNLGETAATGGDRGIWGRLGQEGRPSYAAIDFALADGGRLVAGVHLVRKGEPSVEPTPFLVHGLSDEARLQDLFLVAQGDQEAVPELDELRQNAARLGGRLQTCASAKDYFATLFEHGVTPLRLGTEAERTKLNDMLRTSMTGGISRALTTELRGFLLKEETGLADTLQRMKANLDACRRTRGEVAESKVLQQEIGDVFAAGQAMFTAAFLAGRERAADAERRVQEAEAESREAADKAATARETLASTEAELEELERRKKDNEQDLERARSWETRVRGALTALRDLTKREQVVSERTRELDAAAASDAEAMALRERRRGELRRAEEEHHRAVAGLADLQRGIEDLHRRAGAFRQVVRQQQEAQRLLSLPQLEVHAVEEHLGASQQTLTALDQERRDASARLSDADMHRRQHATALSALQRVVGRMVHVDAAHATAIEALSRHRELVALGNRAPALAEQVDEARRLADRQQRARIAADHMGVATAEAPASERVRSLLDEAEAVHRQHADQERSILSEVSQLERTRGDLELKVSALRAREPLWRRLNECAIRISQQLATQVGNRTELDRARAALAHQLNQARASENSLGTQQERLLAEARELLATSGPFPPALLRLKDQLDANLVAESFDDIDLEQAGWIEARLGPLARALVVDDPIAAAAASQNRDPSLVDVTLVARDANLLADSGTARRDDRPDVVVQEGVALRVSRVPEHPGLGRKARERRAAELRAAANAMEHTLTEARALRRRLEQLVDEGDHLLADQVTWLLGDPTAEIDQVQAQLTSGETKIGLLRKAAATAAEASRSLRPRIDALKRLLPESFLLDPPDHGARLASLQTDHKAAGAAQAEAQRTTVDARVVEELLSVLRTAPLSEADVLSLQKRVEQLRIQRDQLDAGIEALTYVRDNAEALQWREAPQRLTDRQGLVPSLEAQVRETETARQLAQQAFDAAAHAFDKAHEAWQEANGHQKLATKEREAAAVKLASFELEAPTESMLQTAVEEVGKAAATLDAASRRRDAVLVAQGRQRNACEAADSKAKAAAVELATRRRDAEPVIAAWMQLQKRAVAAALHHGVPTEVPTARGQINLMQEAKAQQSILIERLSKAKAGKSLVDQFEGQRDTSEAGFAESMLDLWLLVRDWLRRRLPAQVAEIDDPREALQRLADQLQGLERRLATQETDLRGDSEDVARGIDVQVRKARGHVTRLNKNLRGVGFGSIAGIRVRLEHVEKMEKAASPARGCGTGSALPVRHADRGSTRPDLPAVRRRSDGRPAATRLPRVRAPAGRGPAQHRPGMGDGQPDSTVDR
jgi:chromosome partition protein MukB